MSPTPRLLSLIAVLLCSTACSPHLYRVAAHGGDVTYTRQELRVHEALEDEDYPALRRRTRRLVRHGWRNPSDYGVHLGESWQDASTVLEADVPVGTNDQRTDYLFALALAHTGKKDWAGYVLRRMVDEAEPESGIRRLALKLLGEIEGPAASSSGELAALDHAAFDIIDKEAIELTRRLLDGGVDEGARDYLLGAVERHVAMVVQTYQSQGLAQGDGHEDVLVGTAVVGRPPTAGESIAYGIVDQCMPLGARLADRAVVNRQGYAAAYVGCRIMAVAALHRAGRQDLDELDRLIELAAVEGLREEVTWKVHWVAVRMLLAQGREDEALDALLAAIGDIESYRARAPSDKTRGAYQRERLGLYREAMQLALTLEDDRWFQIAELQRARTFLEAMRAEADSVRAPPSIPELQQVLEPGELFVAYETSGEGLLAMVVSSTSHQSVALPAGRLQAGFVTSDLLRSVQSGDQSFDRERARWLYDRLVAPLLEADTAAGATELVVVPDGWISALPLELLLDPDGRFVAERFPIRYTPSASIHVELAKRTPAPVRRLVALGDPQFDAGELGGDFIASAAKRGLAVTADSAPVPPLPGTRDEVLAAAETMSAKAYAVTTLLSERATETELREVLSQPLSHLLLATHGLLSDDHDDQLEPVLLLGQPDEEQDGVLYASEVYQLGVDADVVVLSACTTAAGADRPIEGILGFSRSFLVGGAGSVVVSRWEVPDAATSALMSEFWQAIARGQPARMALFEARRHWLKQATDDARHPWSWAGFIVYGG